MFPLPLLFLFRWAWFNALAMNLRANKSCCVLSLASRTGKRGQDLLRRLLGLGLGSTWAPPTAQDLLPFSHSRGSVFSQGVLSWFRSIKSLGNDLKGSAFPACSR